MKKIITLMIFVTLLACNKQSKTSTKSKTLEESIIEFCKSDIKTSSMTPSTIKHDSTLTDFNIVPVKYKYYNKTLDEVYRSYGSEQIEDTVSKKWSVSLYYDSENKNGANIRNNVYYIIKENTKYYQDTIFNSQFLILLKRDQNKVHEYLGIN